MATAVCFTRNIPGRYQAVQTVPQTQLFPRVVPSPALSAPGVLHPRSAKIKIFGYLYPLRGHFLADALKKTPPTGAGIREYRRHLRKKIARTSEAVRTTK